MTGKIAVSAAVFAIDKPYSYRIPEEMTLLPGMRVQVPFGRGNKLCDGIVLSVETGDEAELKTVCCALDDAPVLTPTQLKLASFLRERYFCTFFDAARAMLSHQGALLLDGGRRVENRRHPKGRGEGNSPSAGGIGCGSGGNKAS